MCDFDAKLLDPLRPTVFKSVGISDTTSALMASGVFGAVKVLRMLGNLNHMTNRVMIVCFHRPRSNVHRCVLLIYFRLFSYHAFQSTGGDV
jgi:hypothetical protein